MRRGKKPTRKQKIRLGQAGLAPENWLVVKQKANGELIILNKYLAKRYAVPLAPAPRVINKFSKDIAVYNLFSRIGIDEGTDQKTYLNRYNAAIKFLTLVAEGTVSIGTETEDPASAAAGGFKVKSNSRLFTREKMRGM